MNLSVTEGIHAILVKDLCLVPSLKLSADSVRRLYITLFFLGVNLINFAKFS
jgi:hypothetical protein